MRLRVVVFLVAGFCTASWGQTDTQRSQNLVTCLSGRYPMLCNKNWLSVGDRQKVDAAERRENLNTCLSGKYPILCNKALLSPEDRTAVTEAERRENLATCLTGRYPPLCKKGLLSTQELKEVDKAERQENLSTCLTGRFPTVCNHTLLTAEQATSVAAAEVQARALAEAGSLARNRAIGTRPIGRSECESGHWIESVSDDGDIIKLEDGSVWEVDAADTVDSALWLPTTDIIACSGKLINTDDNEKVGATRLR
ncbi:MAG TPA: hypothetical protein VFA68_06310 [Terriglobales bacterium]|nr:hypothetical protein [Terriglobales bacterium]